MNVSKFANISLSCSTEIGFDSDAPDLPPPSSHVRLVNSSDSCSGRVELYYNLQWGTVCDDGFGMAEAHVVCQQLGCGPAISAHGDAHFGEGFGPIWLDEFDCAGDESSIIECTHDGFATHDCGHSEDAGVICEGKHTPL